MSEASSITENTEFLPLRYISSSVNIDKAQTEQLIFEIISKTMPGGIVSGYAAAGDHSLKYFAELLMKYFDSCTILSRFGGDEFVALVKSCFP